MGNAPGEKFALDHRSTSAALHWGKTSSWYVDAYTPTFEELLDVEFGQLAGRRELSDGPHTFGVYWAADNLYMYVDDDARRVLDMDSIFRLKAKKLLDDPTCPALAAEGPVPAEERLALAAVIAEKGYAAGWRSFSRMN